MQDGVLERARHVHLAVGRVAPAQPQVAAAVDHERVVGREQGGQLVGEHALGDPARIDLHAGGTRHRAGPAIGAHQAPARVGRRPAGTSRRCHGQGLRDRHTRAFVVGAVAGLLELGEQRRELLECGFQRAEQPSPLRRRDDRRKLVHCARERVQQRWRDL